MKVTWRKWNPPKTKKQRENKPKSIYLCPSSLSYPYKEKIDGKWVINCNALKSAISLSGMHGRAEIHKKAQRLFNEHCKKSA
ncbi:MAG TPA: hypothetical protein PKW84_07255 [Fervidobacterium sp.]|nr:hypothetical protein [Fervidobacterium sp.]